MKRAGGEPSGGPGGIGMNFRKKLSPKMMKMRPKRPAAMLVTNFVFIVFVGLGILCEIEKECFGWGGGCDGDVSGGFGGDSVAGVYLCVVYGEGAVDQLEPKATVWEEVVGYGFTVL